MYKGHYALKLIHDTADALYYRLLDEGYIDEDDERDEYWRERYEFVLDCLRRAAVAEDPYCDIQAARRAFRELANEVFANNVLERNEPYGRVVRAVLELLDAARLMYDEGEGCII